MRGLVDLVVVLWLEEEVAGLPCGHRHQPASQGRNGGILEDHDVGEQKTYGADKVERLIDPAVMIVAMVVPTLCFQCFKKAGHIYPLRLGSILSSYGDSM